MKGTKFAFSFTFFAPANSPRWTFFAAFAFLLDTTKKIKHGKNANTIGWVAEMIGNHLDANNGEWPSSWGDLDDDYLEVVCEFGQPWQYEELKNCVEIDWATTPLQIRESKNQNPSCLKFRDGYSFPMAEETANARMMEIIDAILK